MTNLILHDLDENLKVSLEKQAKKHGRSLEEEAKEILRTVLVKSSKNPSNLAFLIRKRFTPLGDFDIPNIPRDPLREPPNFEDLL
jgi:plasmid stability protein